MKNYFEHQKQFPTRLSKNKAIQNLCHWGLCFKMFWNKHVKSQRSRYIQLPILKIEFWNLCQTLVKQQKIIKVDRSFLQLFFFFLMFSVCSLGHKAYRKQFFKHNFSLEKPFCCCFQLILIFCEKLEFGYIAVCWSQTEKDEIHSKRTT